MRVLSAPNGSDTPVKRKDIWGQAAAQELTLIGPEQHDEFMLQYQIPIVEKFGLCTYGCCEDLSLKIDILRQIKNLRRIAISPMANVSACAEKIGSDYICSWRPSPANTVCCGFDEDKVRRILRTDMEIFKANNCFFDCCLKDVETVENDPARLKRFVQIFREESENFA